MDWFASLASTLSEVHFIAPTLSVYIAILLVVLLLCVSGFASSSEIAFFSLSPSDLNELDPDHRVADSRIEQLRGDSERTLATILITNNLVNVTIIMLTNYVFANIVDFGMAAWLQFLCVTVLLTFVLLLFGEIIPKVYARQNTLRYCRWASGGIMFARRLFWPLENVLMSSGSLAEKVMHKEKKTAAAPAAAAPAAAPAAPAPKAEPAPGTAGDFKLYNTDPRDAAMVMAIVADSLGKPLNELRFISIREVKEDEV